METDNSFNKNKVIGNVAEAIVEFLVNSTPDWKCIKFGVENHIMDLKKVVRADINNTTRKIKSMPDFIAFNSRTGESFFLEVKYKSFIERRNRKFEYRLNFLKEYIEYWKGTKLIVVHDYSPYFFVIDLNEVKHDMCRIEQVGPNKWEYWWNFTDIQKEIKDLLPNLSDEIIEKAIEVIPKKNGN